jgi:hypothetical protein
MEFSVTSNNHLPVLQNWIARNCGSPISGTFEYPLYSDARFLQSIQNSGSPYNFFNAMPLRAEPGYVQASLILRLDDHIPHVRPDHSRTDASRYHGGSITDEIAALTSLCVGVRIRAGGVSRYFTNPGKEPLGIPVAWDRRPIPSLNLDKDRLVLPHVVGNRGLQELERFSWLLQLSPDQSIALVRAARLYQDALWIAESEPALAWLMLVSSLETAANHWKSDNGTPVDRLTHLKPDLVKILKDAGGDCLVQRVASQIEPSLGATKKFVDFTSHFFPEPPIKRPREELQISWDIKQMKNPLQCIYGYRSKALHGGTPFPAPMCEPPFSNSENEYAEKGTIGLAVGSSGGVWKAKDVPINLHVFHHIVRGALLKWWKGMANGSK